MTHPTPLSPPPATRLLADASRGLLEALRIIRPTGRHRAEGVS